MTVMPTGRRAVFGLPLALVTGKRKKSPMGWQQQQDVTTTTVIVSGPGSGVFVYAGTPGLGNIPVLSMTNATHDPFENPVRQGVISTGTGLAAPYSQMLNGAVNAGVGVALTPASFFSNSAGTGDLSSGLTNIAGDVAAQVSLQSSKATVLGVPVLSLDSASLTDLSGGGVPTILASGLAGFLPLSQTDTSQKTNANLVGDNPITAVWTIPANDAKVGTLYELEVPYEGTWEGISLKIGLSLNGGAYTASNTIAAASFGAGNTFAGSVKIWLEVITAGAGGTVNAFVRGGGVDETAGVNPTDSVFIGGNSIGAPFNTTVANTMQVNCTWSASNVAQTVSGYGSKFTRKGP